MPPVQSSAKGKQVIRLGGKPNLLVVRLLWPCVGTQLPQIILNTFGGGLVAPTSYTDLSYPTIGNLAKTFATKNSVTIPLCSIFSREFQTTMCTMSKTTVVKVRHKELAEKAACHMRSWREARPD